MACVMRASLRLRIRDEECSVDPVQGSGEWRKGQEDDVVQAEEVGDVMMIEDLDESLD